MEAKKKSLARRLCSFPFLLGYGFTLCITLHIVTALSTDFADLMDRTVGAGVRYGLAYLTGWIPISVFEAFLLLLPVIFGIVVTRMILACKKGDTPRAIRVLCVALAILLWVYATFVMGFFPGYQGTTLDVKLSMTEKAFTKTQLQETALWLAREANALSAQIPFAQGGASRMPFDLDTMTDKLNASYKELSARYDFIQDIDVPIKYVANSEVMSFAHITGVYGFFTGEANLNIAFVDHSLPFTAAHEMAHQRGIAREDEANFFAFLVCINSDDPYIRYSGYYEMLIHTGNRLYAEDPAMHAVLMATLSSRIRGELGAYRKFFQKYENSTLGNIAGSFNDAYLQGQGQKEGTKSYGLAANLAVQYYLAYVK